jgi:hypothetical protein
VVEQPHQAVQAVVVPAEERVGLMLVRELLTQVAVAVLLMSVLATVMAVQVLLLLDTQWHKKILNHYCAKRAIMCTSYKE